MRRPGLLNAQDKEIPYRWANHGNCIDLFAPGVVKGMVTQAWLLHGWVYVGQCLDILYQPSRVCLLLQAWTSMQLAAVQVTACMCKLLRAI